MSVRNVVLPNISLKVNLPLTCLLFRPNFWLILKEELSAIILSDINNHEFIMIGVQDICKQCDILPYVIDVAILKSYEKNGPKRRMFDNQFYIVALELCS